MPTLVDAHIEAQARLQDLTVAGVQRAWDQLPSHDEVDVSTFLAIVLPLVLGAQRHSVALTTAFLAQAVSRLPTVLEGPRPAPRPNAGQVIRPLPVDVASVTGAAIRNGTPPQVVYRRPFVTLWTALSDHKRWDDAIAAGRARAAGAAAMDVRNAMRHTLRAVGQADDLILGYRRVPNTDACDFCKLIAGRRYLTGELMEVHVHCKCGVDVITAENREQFSGKTENDIAIERADVKVAIRQHGELGPLIVDAEHHFTGPDELAA